VSRNGEAGPATGPAAIERTYVHGTAPDLAATAGPSVPRPRLAVSPVDPDRDRTRHRLAGARRRVRIIRALDQLLGLRQSVPVGECEPVDYHGTLLDRGVRERELAGRWLA
jgi:hypothetical protein